MYNKMSIGFLRILFTHKVCDYRYISFENIGKKNCHINPTYHLVSLWVYHTFVKTVNNNPSHWARFGEDVSIKIFELQSGKSWTIYLDRFSPYSFGNFHPSHHMLIYWTVSSQKWTSLRASSSEDLAFHSGPEEFRSRTSSSTCQAHRRSIDSQLEHNRITNYISFSVFGGSALTHRLKQVK